jgi:hypothetical protein
VTESNQEVQIPSRFQVAADSCPKKAIATELKRRQSEKSGRSYTLTKRDQVPQKTINWRSPTFWPIIDMVARKQIGKPNLTKFVAQLQQQDNRFAHLTHQRISEWRDKSVKDHIEWTEETMAIVKKEFLPGGHQTRYNVFVSFFSHLVQLKAKIIL